MLLIRVAVLFPSPLAGLSQFQHVLHHCSNPIKDLVDWSIAHESAGGDQLVLRVHVALTDTLAHVLAAQLVDGCSGVSSIGVPEGGGGIFITWQHSNNNAITHNATRQSTFQAETQAC